MQHRIFIVISVFYIWANTFAQEFPQLFPVKEIVLKQKFFINQTQPVLFNDNMMQFLTISKNDVESVTINQGDLLVNDKSNIQLECKAASGGKHKLPLVFTENGVAMLSSILKSSQSIQVNIAIMRTFTKLRSFLAMESSLKYEVDNLKENTGHLFKIVFERLDGIEEQITPKLPPNRKKIGIKKE